MASFEIGNHELNLFFGIAKQKDSILFTETFFAGELERVRDTDKIPPLGYLRQGGSATVVVALPKEALPDLGIESLDEIQNVAHDKIVATLNKWQKQKGGVLFEFRSLFNGAISMNNLVDKDKKQTTLVPDNGLHNKNCPQIKEGIENGTIVPTYYRSIYRLKGDDCRPIRCYCLAVLQEKL